MMKRFLALGLSFIFTLTALPSALAEDDNAGLSALTYEMISPQSRECISENLTLPEEIDGVSISWESSDASVISDKGIVTPCESEEKEVTLTATTEEESKDFVFNVVPENYYVHYSDSFDYSAFESRIITKILPDWRTRMNNASYPSSKFRNETLSDGSRNCYIKNDMWKDRPQYMPEGVKPSGKIKVSYKVYMDIPDSTYAIFDYRFFFGSSSFVRMRFNFYADNTVKVVYTGRNSEDTVGTTAFEELDLKRRWVEMDWVMDTDSKKLWLYIDGELVTKADGLNSARMTGPLEIVDFDLGITTFDTYLGIDDMSVVTMCDNDAQRDVVEVCDLLSLENFLSQSKFAVTENLDFSNVFFDGCEDVNITYESGSDNLVIEENTGKIIRGEEDSKAILNATITKEGTDLSLEKTFEFTVKGKNYKVYDSESFYYPDLSGEKTSVENGGWALLNPTQHEGALDSMYAEERGNYSIKSFRKVSDSSYGGNDQNYFCYWFGDTSKRDVTIEGRIKTGNLKNTKELTYVLNLNGKYKTSKSVLSYTQMHIYVSANSSVRMAANRYNEVKGANQTTTIASDIACPNEWFDFKMEIDMFSKTFSIYINGKCMTPVPFDFMRYDGISADTEATEIAYFCANPFRSMTDCEIYIDDFASYSKQGIFTDTVIYKNGEKTSDLGYLLPDDTLSADVQFYRYPDGGSDDINIVAAVYDGEKMHDAAILSGKTENGKLRVNFPSLDITDTIENMKLKLFCMDKSGIHPVSEKKFGTHKLNGYITPLEHTDSGTGRTYYTIDLNGEDAVRSYYTMPIWSKDSKKFYFYDRLYRMYEYDTETGKYRYIDTLYTENLVMTSKLGNVFYLNRDKEIIRMTPNGEKEIVGTLPTQISVSSATLLQVNNDESYLSLEIFERAADTPDFDTTKKKRITVMNMNTGEWDLRYTYGFDVIDYVPNHINMNPNPEYANLVAFAHEGRGSDCQGNPERIWLLNRSTGEIVNLFKQKMNYGNVPAEIVSHEAWMQSGELMMFANSSSITPGGITLFKTDGSDRRYVNNDYNYLHSAGSTVTDRFVVSDTGYDGKTTKLVLIDCYTGKSYLLATLPQSAVNPGHTHPNFSFDGNKVIFGVNSEDLKTFRIGWMDISDIIDNVADGEEFALSDSCSSTSYGDTDFYVEKTTVNGQEFYNIANGNHLNVNITAFEKETVDVNITFDYLDSGTDDIIIDYVRWETVNGKNRIVDYKETISRTDTGDVKTANVTLSGINSENLKIMGTDFTIKGAETDLSVRNVSVSESKQEAEL